MLNKIEFVDCLKFKTLEEAKLTQDKYLMLTNEDFFFRFFQEKEGIRLEIYRKNKIGDENV